jgi:hypothetical protein
MAHCSKSDAKHVMKTYNFHLKKNCFGLMCTKCEKQWKWNIYATTVNSGQLACVESCGWSVFCQTMMGFCLQKSGNIIGKENRY